MFHDNRVIGLVVSAQRSFGYAITARAVQEYVEGFEDVKRAWSTPPSMVSTGKPAAKPAAMGEISPGSGPKSYQVTGPVLGLTDDVITIQKGTDKWEIGRNNETKVNGRSTIGSKATIQYRLAGEIDVK